MDFERGIITWEEGVTRWAQERLIQSIAHPEFIDTILSLLKNWSSQSADFITQVGSILSRLEKNTERTLFRELFFRILDGDDPVYEENERLDKEKVESLVREFRSYLERGAPGFQNQLEIVRFLADLTWAQAAASMSDTIWLDEHDFLNRERWIELKGGNQNRWETLVRESPEFLSIQFLNEILNVSKKNGEFASILISRLIRTMEQIPEPVKGWLYLVAEQGQVCRELFEVLKSTTLFTQGEYDTRNFNRRFKNARWINPANDPARPEFQRALALNRMLDTLDEKSGVFTDNQARTLVQSLREVVSLGSSYLESREGQEFWNSKIAKALAIQRRAVSKDLMDAKEMAFQFLSENARMIQPLAKLWFVILETIVNERSVYDIRLANAALSTFEAFLSNDGDSRFMNSRGFEYFMNVLKQHFEANPKIADRTKDLNPNLYNRVVDWKFTRSPEGTCLDGSVFVRLFN